MRALVVAAMVVIGVAACGTADEGSPSTSTSGSSPPATDVVCTPGSDNEAVDSAPVTVVVVVAPIAAGTSVRDAVANGALATKEVCAAYAPPAAASSLDLLDPDGTAMADLEPNTVVTNQFG